MNRRCHGDLLLIDGVTYYRCPKDGSLVPGHATDVCPVCRRDVEAPAEVMDCGASFAARRYNHPEFGPQEMIVRERVTMPVTGWEDIAGYPCACCGKPATHFYGNAIAEHAVCCDCHAGENGGLYTAEQAANEHARILIRRAEEGGE